MKAEELRVGNLVWYNGSINIVTGIIPPAPREDRYLDGHWVIEINPPDVFNVRLVDIKPVLITEDRLLRFGFAKERLNRNQGAYYSDCGNFEYTLDGCFNAADAYYTLSTEINYAHQIQNLYFDLTGKELVLKF